MELLFLTPSKIPVIADEDVEETIEKCLEKLKNKSENFRCQGVWLLGALGNRAYPCLQQLFDELKNSGKDRFKNRSYRQRLVEALGKIAPTNFNVLLYIIELSREDESDIVRSECADFLGKIKRPSQAVLGALVERIQDDCSMTVRIRALSAIESIGPCAAGVSGFLQSLYYKHAFIDASIFENVVHLKHWQKELFVEKLRSALAKL